MTTGMEHCTPETLEQLRRNLNQTCLEALKHHEAGTFDVSRDGHAAPPREALFFAWNLLLKVEETQRQLEAR